MRIACVGTRVIVCEDEALLFIMLPPCLRAALLNACAHALGDGGGGGGNVKTPGELLRAVAVVECALHVHIIKVIK